MKKGFTLIELLAVIVILAIIALIATPIILGIIDNARTESKQRSAELYLTAVKQAIVQEKINGNIDFNPKECTIVENNTLNCDMGEIKVDVGAENVTAGYIKLNDGKIENYSLTINGEEQTNVEETPESCFTTNTNEDNTVTITDYTCSNKDLVIPSTIGGKTVVSIDAAALGGYEITSVVIPNSVTEIGEYAFNNNKIIYVVIPDSVTTIKEAAFSMNSLKNVVIPDSVTEIGQHAFNDNELTSIVIPNKITSIDVGVFGYNQLTNVIISNNIESIGAYAFYENPLTSVTIQNSSNKVDIGEEAFGKFDINNIVWELEDEPTEEPEPEPTPSSCFDTSREDTSKVAIIDYTCERQNVVIPSTIGGMTVYRIAKEAFSEKGLKSIILPNTIESIGQSAFSENSLTSIIIPSSVTSIEAGAFFDNSLTSLTIRRTEGYFSQDVIEAAFGFDYADIIWQP